MYPPNKLISLGLVGGSNSANLLYRAVPIFLSTCKNQNNFIFAESEPYTLTNYQHKFIILMYYDLTKGEKKIARTCIDKGLDAEFREGIEKVEKVIQDWRNGKFATNKEAYHEMFSTLHEKNRAIAKRYDNLGGSRWLYAVAQIFRDGYISEEDISRFHEGTKLRLKQWASRID